MALATVLLSNKEINTLNRLLGNSSPFIFFRPILFISFGYWLFFVRSYMVYFLNDVAILISNERVINVFFFLKMSCKREKSFCFSLL